MKLSNQKNIIKVNSSEKFKIVSDFNPNGDQPKAIKTLVKNIKAGDEEQGGGKGKAGGGKAAAGKAAARKAAVGKAGGQKVSKKLGKGLTTANSFSENRQAEGG